MTYNYDFVKNEESYEEIILGDWYGFSAMPRKQISRGNKISFQHLLSWTTSGIDCCKWVPQEADSKMKIRVQGVY